MIGRMHTKKIGYWAENKARLFNLILGQCHTSLLEHLKTLSIWKDSKENHKVVDLLVMACGLCHKHNKTKQGEMTSINQDISLDTFVQKSDMPCDEFQQLFYAQIETANAYGGRAGYYFIYNTADTLFRSSIFGAIGQ